MSLCLMCLLPCVNPGLLLQSRVTCVGVGLPGDGRATESDAGSQGSRNPIPAYSLSIWLS